MRGLDRGEEDDGIYQRIVIVQTVQLEVICLCAKTVHRESSATRLAVTIGLGISIGAGSVAAIRTAGHTRNQQGKLGEVAAVQRQLRDLASLNYRSGGRSGRVDDRDCIGYGDRAACRPWVHAKVQGQCLRNLKG